MASGRGTTDRKVRELARSRGLCIYRFSGVYLIPDPDHEGKYTAGADGGWLLYQADLAEVSEWLLARPELPEHEPPRPHVRDSQQGKVYAAEERAKLERFAPGSISRELFPGKGKGRHDRLHNKAALQSYLSEITSQEWFTRAFPGFPPTTIATCRRQHSSYSTLDPAAIHIGRHTVRSAGWKLREAATELAILHETAHITDTSDGPGHGPAFRAAHIVIVRGVLGPDAAGSLDAEYGLLDKRVTSKSRARTAG